MTHDTTTEAAHGGAEGGAPSLRGGLPEDTALDAFGIETDVALAAFGTNGRSALPPHGEVENPADPGGGGAAASPLATDPVPHSPVPRTARPIGVTPDPGSVPADRATIGHAPSEASSLPTQCTIMVQPQVRERFGRYQTAQKVEAGVEPTNAVVVKRAFLHAHRHHLWAQLREAVRHRQQPVSEEDHDPDGLFGEVPARRVDRGGVKHGVQQSFRPSPQELAVYDRYAAAYSFDNRSDFLDAVLDAFLPQLPASRRASR
ncbi:hypothetical protein [Streptomyces chartreusis]|uniref:hypothetical protein n=1 Tax=Streptomyces chartreusis TaxID=1969 RepID=UPI003815AEE2